MAYAQQDQPDGVPPLELTGERTLPDVPEENYWYRRHVAVYEWIAERCEGKRVVYEWGQVRVSDGGPDGLVASDPQDNTEFMKQGIFIP